MNVNCESTWKEGCGKVYDNSFHLYYIDTNINQSMGKKKAVSTCLRPRLTFFISMKRHSLIWE